MELVYDNYRLLAIGYAATERATDCLVSLAVSAEGRCAVVLLWSIVAES